MKVFCLCRPMDKVAELAADKNQWRPRYLPYV